MPLPILDTDELNFDERCRLCLPLKEFLSAGVVEDISDYNNHGNVTGAVPSDIGFYFDGSDDKIIVPDDNSLDVVDNFTVEFWIKPITFEGDDWLIHHGEWEVAGWDIRGKILNSQMQFGCHQAGVKQYQVSNAGVISTTRWAHCALVKSGNAAQWYVDLNDENSGATVLTNPVVTGEDMVIGMRHTLTKKFKGYLAYIMFFAYAKPHSEIAEDYNITKALLGIS